MFLIDAETNIFSYNLRIPYDCEFIIIQPMGHHLHRYKLTEIYQVKNKSFSFVFGTWSGALNVTDVSFYERRLNLNESIITTVGFQEFSVNVSRIILF